MAVSTRTQAAAASHPGQRRGNNEDRFLCDPERGIFLVIDGMGGQAAGEKAAEIALSVMKARLERQTGTAEDRVREAITLANNEILQAAEKNPEWRGMACVLTAAIVEDRRALIGHVGDSRLYLLRPGEIRKLTHDHSPVGEREDRGDLSETDAMAHPRRNEVYRDVGSAAHQPDDPEFIETLGINFPADGALLLCSDGLSDMVTAAAIRTAVEASAGRPKRAVHSLIEAANRAGGKDNITAVLVENPEYAPGVRAISQESHDAPAANGRYPAWYGSRWAFLLLGLILGGVLLFLVQSRMPRKPVSPPEQAEARTWRVGPEGDTTIGAAMSKAQLGDTVLVAPGVYHEPVHLRDGVDLVSLQSQAAVIAPGNLDVGIDGENLTEGRLVGFRIVGDDGRPLSIGLALKDSRIEVDDVEVTGARTAGVDIYGDSMPTLRACRIVKNVGPGILIRGTAQARLVHNLISENGQGARNGRPGVEIRDAARAVLTGNTFIGNSAEPVWTTRNGVNGDIADNHFLRAPVGIKGTARYVRVFP
jgi:serine/threonine protein phosphatase PrpC